MKKILPIILFILCYVVLMTNNGAMAQLKRSRYTYKQKKLRPLRKQNRKVSRKGSPRNSISSSIEGILHMSGSGILFFNATTGERTLAMEGSYDHNISERFFSRTTFSYEWGEVFSVQYRGHYFHHGVGGALFKLNSRYYLNGLAGVTVVYDRYPALELLNDRWHLGLHYGLEVEVGILPTLATVVSTRQFIMRDSPNRWMVSAGVKFRLH